ncbi:MAG TPA: VOC family protein [Microlunatus sp.]|jgi:hypothetical protein|nr:VOC family protein [Microlunatus sp.]
MHLENLVIDAVEPQRLGRFWEAVVGGVRLTDQPDGFETRLAIELCPEIAPKGPDKNRLHLDLRLDTGDDPDTAAAGITERGGRELFPEWGELPWRLYADPSGNDFCVLPAR